MRYVVLDDADEVVNVVLWDGETPWEPGEDLRAVPEAEYLASRAADAE